MRPWVHPQQHNEKANENKMATFPCITLSATCATFYLFLFFLSMHHLCCGLNVSPKSSRVENLNPKFIYEWYMEIGSLGDNEE
jgi:hypothetical protein